MSSYVLVSPPFACGVAWLVNILLELQVRTTHWTSQDVWREINGNWAVSEKAAELLQWHLPILHKKSSFPLRGPQEIFWEHRLDLATLNPQRAVLYLRDPRDAIFSLYRRDIQSGGMDYEAYLDRRDVWPHHFPGLFFLPPPETFLLFVLTWSIAGRVVPLQVVTFESMRGNPLSDTRRILEHYGITRSDREISAALYQSQFAKARRAMEKSAEARGYMRLTASRGQVGEWRETHSPEARERFAPMLTHYDRLVAYGLETYREQVLRFAGRQTRFDAEPAATADLIKEARQRPTFPSRAAVIAAYWARHACKAMPFISYEEFYVDYFYFLLSTESWPAIKGLAFSSHFDRILGLLGEI